MMFYRITVCASSAQSLESFGALLKTFLFKLSLDELEKRYKQIILVKVGVLIY